MLDPGPVLVRLRRATADAHKSLEDQLDAIERLSRMADRRQLLPRYYRMHASAESGLERWLGQMDGLDYPARRRVPVLAEDLRALDLTIPTIEPLAVASTAEALGHMYVLEGSSLGGRMMMKALAGRGATSTGLGFLDPYGADTGARWRSFLEILERDGAVDIDGVERGGVRGFNHAADCLLVTEAA